jgi:hypothetical protein
MKCDVVIAPALAGTIVMAGWTYQPSLPFIRSTTIDYTEVSEIADHIHVELDTLPQDGTLSVIAASASANVMVYIGCECGASFEACIARNLEIGDYYSADVCPNCGELLMVPGRLTQPLIKLN